MKRRSLSPIIGCMCVQACLQSVIALSATADSIAAEQSANETANFCLLDPTGRARGSVPNLLIIELPVDNAFDDDGNLKTPCEPDESGAVNLRPLPGVVDVLVTNHTAILDGAQYKIELSFTNRALNEDEQERVQRRIRRRDSCYEPADNGPDNVLFLSRLGEGCDLVFQMTGTIGVSQGLIVKPGLEMSFNCGKSTESADLFCSGGTFRNGLEVKFRGRMPNLVEAWPELSHKVDLFLDEHLQLLLNGRGCSGVMCS